MRVLEIRDCPDGEVGDLARVLIGSPLPGGYRSELWRLRRSKATWVLDGIERTDPSSLEVLELLRDEYPRGTRCVQYL